MDKEDIKRLKDSVYELEGLLELAQLRDDKLPELEPLIKGKIDEIGEMAKYAPASASIPDMPSMPREASYIYEEKPVPVAEEMTVAKDAPVANKPELTVTDPEEPVYAVPEKKGGRREKPAFCINDRFRFRRELFNNSDTEFSAAMDKVTTMSGYEEAENYFLGDLGWDPESPEVIDFLEIIKLYFS